MDQLSTLQDIDRDGRNVRVAADDYLAYCRKGAVFI